MAQKKKKTSLNKKIFTSKQSYHDALEKEDNKIEASEQRIDELRKMLENYGSSKTSSKVTTNKKKVVKPKMVNGISVDQKHTIVKSSEANKYNYRTRLNDWRKKAGYNKKPHKCSRCNDECYTSILLDNKKHICYHCWIKKPEQTKTKKSTSSNKYIKTVKTVLKKKTNSTKSKKKK